MMNKWGNFRTLSNSTFFHNILILVSGSALAQAISFVSLILLQRWFYEPEDFGVLGLYVSLSTLFVGCSTLKLEYGIVLPKDDRKALSLVQLSFLSVVFVTFASLLTMVFFRRGLIEVPDEQYYTFLFLIPFTVVFSGLYEILTYWNNRGGNFSVMSKSKVVQSTSMEMTRMIGGLSGVDYKGLIVGRVFGQLISSLYLAGRFFREYRSEIRKVDTTELKSVFREYRDFPFFTMPTVFITNFSNLLLIALFFQFYGDSEAGLVSIAIQYIALPFGMIAASFSQVFYQKISVFDDAKQLLRLYLKLATRLGAVSLLVTIAVYLIPEWLILILVGEKWRGLTEFMKLSVMWQSIAFVSSSLSFIYTRLMKQRVMMLFAILQLGIVYITLSFGNNYYSDPYKSFALYVAGQSFYYLSTLLAAVYFIRKSEIINKSY